MTSTDQQIILACRQGKRKAQNELYHKYCDAMYNICLRMLNQPADAEDVLQQAFVTVFTKLDQFRMQSTLGAWIKRIVINACIDHLRIKNYVDEWDSNMEVPEQESLVEAEHPYRIEQIKKAMEHLSMGYRVVLNLYLFEGLDHIEIAKYLGISHSTSKTQYHRAKKRLIGLLNELN